jgi:hypothetical protein
MFWPNFIDHLSLPVGPHPPVKISKTQPDNSTIDVFLFQPQMLPTMPQLLKVKRREE